MGGIFLSEVVKSITKVAIYQTVAFGRNIEKSKFIICVVKCV